MNLDLNGMALSTHQLKSEHKIEYLVYETTTIQQKNIRKYFEVVTVEKLLKYSSQM